MPQNQSIIRRPEKTAENAEHIDLNSFDGKTDKGALKFNDLGLEKREKSILFFVRIAKKNK